jgi:hypothetical protein
MGVRKKVFYPMAFASMLFASSAIAKINPTAFVGVTEYFLKDQSKDMTCFSPTLGEIALESGLIENIRFFGPFEPGTKEGERDYTADSSKDHLWNMVKILFPSNNGQLGTVTGATTNFAKHVKDPKIVAFLLNYAKKVEDVPEKSSLKKQVTAEFADSIAKAFEPKDDAEQRKFVNIVIPLLNHIRGAIEAEKRGTSLYPRHTTEQVIEAFFCYHFNTQEDIWPLLENLDGSIVDKSKSLPVQAHYLEEKDLHKILVKQGMNLDDFFNLSQGYIFTSPIPYKPGINLLNNGTTNFYDRIENRQIKGRTSQDCVEMAMRHICNLLLFNPDPQARNFELKSIEAFVTSKEEATHVENPYFGNFRKFYEVQQPLLANAGDIGTRSLWNMVVGNLPKTNYCQEANEIKSGFINLLNTFDTLFNLSLKAPPINGLAEKKKWVEESFQKLFSALNPSYAYTIDFNARESGDELIGDALITVAYKLAQETEKAENLFSFNLKVSELHTEINELKRLTRKNSDILYHDYASKIEQDINVLKMGTAEESLLLLASPNLQKNIHPLYKLYSTPLSDNTSKINLLRELDKNYESWETLPFFQNNLPLIQSMVKNVLNGVGWDDATVVNEITPVIKSLLNKRDLEKTVGSAVRALQFSDSGWDEIKSLVKKVPKLGVLGLIGNYKIAHVDLTDDFKEIEFINFTRSPVKKIENLDLLPNLKTLSLLNASNLREIPLKGLRNLETLSLSSTYWLEELSVRGLENLKVLQVTNLGIKEIEGLNTLLNLETLILGDLGFEELSVEGLKSLKTFKFSRSNIKKIGGLKTLSSLEDLDLNNTQNIKEISLGGLINLKKLNFSNSKVEKIEDLDTLVNLESLNLGATKGIKELSFIRIYKKINDLNLERSNISNLQGLDYLPNLKRLNLNGAENIQELQFTQDNKDLFLSLKNSGVKNRNQIKGIEHLDEDKIEW